MDLSQLSDFFTLDRSLEIAGFITGLAYLWFEYHANRLVWLTSMIMPMISVWVYFRSGLYADFAINIYYLVIAVYGYIAWSIGSKRKEGPALRITHTPARMYVVLVCALAVIFAVLAYILVNFTPSNVPYYDAFTTALSIVAMWMMARKYAEQWLAWLIVDAVCIGLYYYKQIYFYSALYAVYTVIAALGYRKWLSLMRQGI